LSGLDRLEPPLVDAGAMTADSIAGYRIIRRLGSGSRADVYLGHAGEGNRVAAIKVFRAGAAAASIDAELRALGAASHAHTVQLREQLGKTAELEPLEHEHGKAIGPGRLPVLVLERLELGSLAQLLAQRAQLAPGEAVTILAPLAAAVTAMQSTGVVHGAISATRVLFRESGAPVLSGFGHASLGASSDVDRRALAALALTVLERVRQAGELRAWLQSLLSFSPSFADQLAERVFGLAEAAPVRFDADSTAVEAVPPRTTVAEPVEVPEPAAQRWWQPYADAVVERVPERFRRPRWLAAGAGALTLLVAISVPAGGHADELRPTAAPTVTASGPVVEDDPVAAFSTLSRVRNDCIHELSILCLDAVLQPDSSAMDDDIELIRAIERGDASTAAITPKDITLGERIGDVALLSYLDNGKPASVLLVRTEAGWRIRGYL
jgi:hypothetical protein